MIRQPTIIINVFGFTFPTSKAPNGAAMIPPTTKPAIIGTFCKPINQVKTPALENATKNSVALTVPMVY